MPHLVLEVGCEELPAHSVRRAVESLASSVTNGLRDAKLINQDFEVKTACTPRRLIVGVDGVVSKQADETIEKRGPSKQAAFDSDGKPTKALEGFCRANGADVSAVTVRDDYVWIRAEVKGRTAHEVLSEVLAHAIQSIPFDKTMRWGSGRMRFARPIRWILAVFDRSVVPFQIETVESGNHSHGHRFLCPDPFEAHSFGELIESLRDRFVEAEPAKREAVIRKEAAETSENKAILNDSLVDENVFLTEWPHAIEGSFREEFLSLPRPVLVTAMAKHERFFPIEDESGEITNRFISIMNAGDEGVVRRGNEWVLNARFNDALFFYQEDSRTSLQQFLERTDRILFQEKLGSIRQRADRIASLAKRIAKQAKLSQEEIEWCCEAGRLCKADLSTGLVSELPSLQGHVGGEYARMEKYPDAICEGIANHYDPNFSPSTPEQTVALVVMCADQSDRLAGYLGIGEVPKGSSDPYALRKAVTMLVHAQLGWNAPMDAIQDWIESAAGLYREQGFSIDQNAQIVERFDAILEGRYEALLTEIRYDAREAVWSANHRQPSRHFLARAKAIAELASDIAFVRTARRPINIVTSAKAKGIGFDDAKRLDAIDQSLLDHDAEANLLEAACAIEPKISNLVESANYHPVAATLRELSAPIDAYFDLVMVMTEDEAKRRNRLEMLAGIARLFLSLGDFSKIVIEGE
jgi:glycyl-tRNA synthetase beta chain